MAVRMLDVPNAQFSSVYSDVSEDDWFAGVVMQAMEQEIISRDEYFRPNDNVTREEMCKILMNILDLLGKADDATGVELNFADGTEISDWAVPYVKDAVKNGIIQGMGDNTFAPKKGATSAEVATVIFRMLEKIN